jgi:competence ComEA-like helix-hairpin-helix protein
MLHRKRRIPLHLAILAFCFVCGVSSAATKKPPVKPININTANSEELQQVPGIGPVTAEKIVQMRKSYGTFKSVDDLLSIKGIGKKRLEKMRKYLTVTKSTATNKMARPAVSGSPLLKKPDLPPSASPSEEAEDPPR